MIGSLLRRRRYRWIVGILLLAVGALAVLHTAFYQGYLRLNYPSLERYPVRGIDISHHQRQIDWPQLDSRQIHFVLIKASEGGDFRDPLFASNWQAAGRHGFIKGAYHFFTFCKSGLAQAENFIATVPVESGTLPPAIDLEYGANCQAPDAAALIREIGHFLQRVEAVYGKKAIIYATREFYDDHLQRRFPDNPVWIRDIYRQPNLPDAREWQFWQYANRGRVAGITTFVDLNVFRFSAAQLQALTAEQ
ncbi:GH25 family lysozyme [Entomohabitans teleogrylli]|uniref:glycoside hydrolase family 25 protein n=1 Tax=Entomohabitans teleogrylli TaxID=1384589 RepID=UPI000A532DBB|nr:GH25 family lysozyme [Entomohabitans teleogrylli]